jgi:DNA (cytosine-5)-methyltransferase 1
MRKKNIAGKKPKIVGIDFFSGCGGVSYGFKKAGIDVLLGLDNDNDVSQSYLTNNKPAHFMSVDIKNHLQNVVAVKEYLKSTDWDYSVFSACAPCQPFSSQNRNFRDDDRKSLLLHFIEVIEKLEKKYHPSFIFAENVGPIKLRGKEILNLIIKKLNSKNYSILQPIILNAANFGIPQNRKRMILVAVNNNHLDVSEEKFNWNYFKHKFGENEVTLKDAIGHLPKLAAGKKDPNDILHTAMNLSERNLNRIKQITVPGGTRLMWKPEDVLECHKNFSGHKDVYGRMWWNRPAPTLTTKFIGLSHGRFGHPEQHRAISLREGAILQTMEKFLFDLNLSKEKIAKQIGNAVPPKLAKKFGEYFIELAQGN